MEPSDVELTTETWNNCLSKGRLLLAAMRAPLKSSLPYTTPSPWTTHSSLALNGWDVLSPPHYFFTDLHPYTSTLHIDNFPARDIVRELQHTRDSGIANTPSFFPRTDANHAQIFNHQSGTIFRANISSPREKLRQAGKGADIPTNPEVLQHWSDIAFLEWSHLARANELRNFQRVVHCKVTNEITMAIMNHVFYKKGRSPLQDVTVFTVYTVEDGDDFLALLGTPNASGMGLLLAQHKEQLGVKVVKRIVVAAKVTEDGTAWSMVLETEG